MCKEISQRISKKKRRKKKFLTFENNPSYFDWPRCCEITLWVIRRGIKKKKKIYERVGILPRFMGQDGSFAKVARGDSSSNEAAAFRL